MGATQVVGDGDVGRTECCQVYVADNQTGESCTVTSNAVGPVSPLINATVSTLASVQHCLRMELCCVPGAGHPWSPMSPETETRKAN